MSTVTYITNTTAARARYLIVDGERETAEEWFEAELPGDEVSELRGALIEAAERLNGEDRALLDANGFKVTTIPVKYAKADDARVFGEYNFADFSRDGILNAIAAECESNALTDGYASTWETLTVLEEIGGDVAKFLD